jgi:hypothetical protein
MTLHGMLSPVIKFVIDCLSDGKWLQSERVSTEIQHRVAVVLREYELAPERPQRILLIQHPGKFK